MTTASEQTTDRAPRRWSKTRLIAFLVGSVVCELLAFGTWISAIFVTGRGYWTIVTLAVALAALPLLLLAWRFWRRGRTFSMRAMMIATALIAVCLSMVAYPVAKAKSRRRGMVALIANGIRFDNRSQSHALYDMFDVPFQSEPSITSGKVDDLPIWMLPLLNSSFPYLSDSIVRRIELYSDEQVEQIAPLLGCFENLQQVVLSGPDRGRPGVTNEGFGFFAEHSPPLESVHVTASGEIPPDWGGSLQGVRLLSIGYWPPSGPQTLTDEQLRGLLATPGLEALRLEVFGINGQNASLLSESPDLKRLILWGTKVTESDHTAIRQANPQLRLRVGPTTISPESFWHAISRYGGMYSMRVTYNEQRSVWEREIKRGSRNEMGDGMELIDKRFPIEIEIKSLSKIDRKFVRNRLNDVYWAATHAGLSEVKRINDSPFSGSVTFREKPPRKVRIPLRPDTSGR